ncbi:transketolase [Clostridium formicaceticum]|uniref:Transketolase n=1 Tax=Clostridium formicaceticum TaxID=1497 RepID=A0AAC9RMX7_9CLOT|nr:transketolase [Clostridium formicaceticum]AOY74626.1 transketolase [Clostridium formicaceticum]ARE88991.1 Transketolase [Clostridium formicaceticum]
MGTIDNLAINTIRFLAVDGIEKAKSGHPGLPLGAAPAAYTLWAHHLKHNPKNPRWQNRDRFILSAGHGSMLLYSLLYLFGYGLAIEDLKSFRQFKSKTPGHPEYGHTSGVEITTGPLGQGIANAVGMAMAESFKATKFNRDGFNIVDNFVYTLCGDGCLMEGVASEAASLAGSLGLGKLIVLYDSNNITIEGDTTTTFNENVLERFKAYGWQTIYVSDGNNIDELNEAIKSGKADLSRPTIIEIKTKIGYGSPNKQGKASAHGEPLGAEEIILTKKALGWDYEESFFVPEEVVKNMKEIISYCEQYEKEWNDTFSTYTKTFPDLAQEWDAWHNGFSLKEKTLDIDGFWNYDQNLATRQSNEIVLNKIKAYVPNLIGGSADLAPSTKTIMKRFGDFSKENYAGDNLHFGVREHAMAAIANGIAAYGGLTIYTAGFFVFSDYMKPAMRLSALMKLPVIYIMTHDSIGVGEDGPTHQPVEQLAMLRSIPNFTVIRPCDTKETAAAWIYAINRKDTPTALILTRQTLPLLNETGKGALKGGYIVKDSENPDIILMASGSEVSIIYKAYDLLKEKGYSPRILSMPSMEIFDEQPEEYKEMILPKAIQNRIAVEAASSLGWHKYVGMKGQVVSIDRFGMSAPAEKIFKEYGITVEHVCNTALKMMDMI